jgi:hypothetical protein
MAVYMEMRFKHELACWRPIDWSAQVQPMITTPGHGSLPSGHCTQSYVVVEVLKALLNIKGTNAGPVSFGLQLDRMAARIATNRVIAGVHFPVDNVAGRLLGKVLGEYFVYRCGGAAGKSMPWHTGQFHGTQFEPNGDFQPFQQAINLGGAGKASPGQYYQYTQPLDLNGVPTVPGAAPEGVLQFLWEKAVEECLNLGLLF